VRILFAEFVVSVILICAKQTDLVRNGFMHKGFKGSWLGCLRLRGQRHCHCG
jgi:hypothetical protein